MIKIAIVDDNLSVCTKIEKTIEGLLKEKGLKAEIDVFLSIEESQMVINEKRKYHLIFIDVHINDKSGVKLAEAIRNFDPYSKLIYISYDASSALKLFDTNPFNFILKPLKEEKIIEVFNKACALIFNNQDIHEFQINKMKYRIPLENILYFESNKRKVNVVTHEESYTYYEKMKSLEKKLQDKNFHRIHSSYLVNDAYIKVYRYNEVMLVNGDILPISQSNRKRMRRMIL